MSYPNITQDIQELQAFQANLINLVYPVGSIYMSVNNVSPQTFLGGTWEQIEDTFLLSAGSKHTAGSTGGEESHILSVAESPSHTHTRGTMEITGNFEMQVQSWSGGFDHLVRTTSGAFTRGDRNGSSVASDTPAQENRDYKPDVVAFNASRSWTGETSSVGGNVAHNNMPPYLTVYMWKRIS